MRISISILLGLSLFFMSQAQAAITDYKIIFTASQGPDGVGQFTYDDTPGLERLSDIPLQFGPSLSGTILTPTPPPPWDDDEFHLFQTLSGPDDLLRAFTIDSNSLIGFDLFHFESGDNSNPFVYAFWEEDINGDFVKAGAGSFSISAIPIPAALPLFGSALSLLGFIGWKRRTKV